MRIGIMGGTFDPIHLAHLEMGREAKKQKQLDEVWFMPSKIPPHKQGKGITDEKIRYKMVELAVQGEDGFVASDFELRYPNVTYTAQTLERLRERFPEDTFFFMMGGDSLLYFEQWYHPEKILASAEILVFLRDGISRKELEARALWLTGQFGGTMEMVSMKRMDISSSMIRERIQKGEEVRSFLPEAVYDYLMANEVYTQEKGRTN